jgi:microfibrillar-associated protein 1
MSTARKQAPRLARPAARYRKGQLPKGIDAAALESDSDEEAEEEQAPQEPGDVALSGEVAFGEESDEEDDGGLARGPAAPKKGMNVALRDVNISKDGKVIVAGREESGRTAAEAGAHYWIRTIIYIHAG